MARPLGFEPKTLCLEGRCSIQLSYGRNWRNISGRGAQAQARLKMNHACDQISAALPGGFVKENRSGGGHVQ